MKADDDSARHGQVTASGTRGPSHAAGRPSTVPKALPAPFACGLVQPDGLTDTLAVDLDRTAHCG